MRLATKQDIPALMPIAVSTLRVAYPGLVVGDELGGFAEQVTRTGVLVAVTDDLSAFILSERIEPRRWMVRFLMPLDMPAATGTALIAFAFAEEHKLRPFLATDETFATLNENSQVERGTASSYKLILNSGSRDVLDAGGVKRATEIYMPATALARALGVSVVFARRR